MNYLDIIVGALLAFALFKGFKNGLIIELASLAALVLGILGAVKFSCITAGYLSQYIDSGHIGLIAFIVTFILIVVGIHMVARVVDKLVAAVALGFVNRFLGAAFSILKYAFIMSVVIAVLNGFGRGFDIIPKEQKENSFLYGPVSSIAPSVFPYLYFDEVKDKLEDVTTVAEI